MARVLLDRADKVDSLEKRRKLHHQAFELVQQAIMLRRPTKKRKDASYRATTPMSRAARTFTSQTPNNHTSQRPKSRRRT